MSAAHVAANARDSSRFDVSVNVEPQKKAAFYLSYEELLQREQEQYEVVINIHPGQLVKELQVEVLCSYSKQNFILNLSKASFMRMYSKSQYNFYLIVILHIYNNVLKSTLHDLLNILIIDQHKRK